MAGPSQNSPFLNLNLAFQKHKLPPASQEQVARGATPRNSARFTNVVLKRAAEIIEVIKKNDITIVQGDTGCGKSTGLPHILLREALLKLSSGPSTLNSACPAVCAASWAAVPRIVVTEPRRVAATSLAARVCGQMNKDQEVLRAIGHFKEKVNLSLGGMVGYRVRFDERVSHLSKLTYVTDGLLIRECLMSAGRADATNPCAPLGNYEYVVVDEAHERTIRVDQLLAMCRIHLSERKSGFKLIVMSATLNIEDLEKFFSSSPAKLSVGIIRLEGKQFPVQVYYTPRVVEDFVEAAVATVCQILVASTHGDILVFLPGVEEILLAQVSLEAKIAIFENFQSRTKVIRKMHEFWLRNPDILQQFKLTKDPEKRYDILFDHLGVSSDTMSLQQADRVCALVPSEGEATSPNKKRRISSWYETRDKLALCGELSSELTDQQDGNWEDCEFRILPLFASLSSEEQKKVFEKPSSGLQRKIILATNIAETSITLPNIKFVVDSAKVKRKIGHVLKSMDISQSMGEQRAGRAGRVSAGITYRLLPEKVYNSLPYHSPPEILVADVVQYVLDYKHLDGDERRLTKFLGKDPAMCACEARDLPLPTPPPDQRIGEAEDTLKRLGATHGVSQTLTKRGKLLCLLPIPVLWGNLILTAIEDQCLQEVLTIVSMGASQDAVWFPVRTIQRKEGHDRVHSARKRLLHPESDHISMLLVYNHWKQSVNKAAFCRLLDIDGRNLAKAEKMRNQILDLLLNHPEFALKRLPSCLGAMKTAEAYDLIRRCLARGLFLNIAIQEKPEDNSNLYRNQDCDRITIHPASTFFALGRKRPKCFVYSTLLETTSKYARDVTAIDERWALELQAKGYRPDLNGGVEMNR